MDFGVSWLNCLIRSRATVISGPAYVCDAAIADGEWVGGKTPANVAGRRQALHSTLNRQEAAREAGAKRQARIAVALAAVPVGVAPQDHDV